MRINRKVKVGMSVAALMATPFLGLSAYAACGNCAGGGCGGEQVKQKSCHGNGGGMHGQMKRHGKHGAAMKSLSQEAQAAAEKVEAVGAVFLTPKALQAKLQSEAPPVLIDVLPAESYKKNHISGAINIPAAKISDIAPTVIPDKGAPVVVYCANYRCGASLRAAKALKEAGYTNVYDYKGGLQAWEEAGYKLAGTEGNG